MTRKIYQNIPVATAVFMIQHVWRIVLNQKNGFVMLHAEAGDLISSTI
jgi:hypothetical protein